MKSFAVAAALVAAVKAASLGNTEYTTITAGQTFTVTWYGAEGTVQLDLRDGDSGNLQQLETLTSAPAAADGTGSYQWAVPAELPGKGPYALVITDSTGVNYSPQFEVIGAVEAATTATSAASTTAAPTSTAASTEASSINAMHASTSLVRVASSTYTSALATKTSGTSAVSTLTPTTVPDDDSKAPAMASPFAMILLSAVAMFYLH